MFTYNFLFFFLNSGVLNINSLAKLGCEMFFLLKIKGCFSKNRCREIVPKRMVKVGALGDHDV